MTVPRYATAVAFPREVGEVALARRAELQSEVLKQSNRLTERYGRNRDGYLFAAAVAISIGALVRDQANIKAYGGVPQVSIPEAVVDGKPRADFIEEMLAEQATLHRDAHRRQEPGQSAPPSKCFACQRIAKLGFTVATDAEVGSDLNDETPPESPAVLVVRGNAETLRAILRGEPMPELTAFTFIGGEVYRELAECDDVAELRETLLGPSTVWQR